MHAGGLRADLVPDEQGLLRYQQLFAVQPFGNSLEVRTYTGAQLHALLEQQFDDSHSSSYSRVLSVSQGLSYRYDLRQPPGQRVQDLRLHGVPIEPTQPVRAVMSSFLAAGGSGFSVFTQGQEPTGGGQDIDALEAYFRTHSPVAPSSSARIQRIDIQ
jgi:5'-nucleotidase